MIEGGFFDDVDIALVDLEHIAAVGDGGHREGDGVVVFDDALLLGVHQADVVPLAREALDGDDEDAVLALFG